MSAKNKAARLKFLKEHKNLISEHFKLVIWSDQTKINRINSVGPMWTWYDKR